MGNIWGPIPPFPHALISAVRHLRTGGAIGIFPRRSSPEPAHEIRPFLPGLGHMVVKGKARVLVAVVDGTPHTHELGQDLFIRSHPPPGWGHGFEPTATPDEVSDAVRAKLVEASGCRPTKCCKWPWPGPMGFDRPRGQTGSGGAGINFVIDRIRGKLLSVEPDRVVLECGPLDVEVAIPACDAAALHTKLGQPSVCTRSFKLIPSTAPSPRRSSSALSKLRHARSIARWLG